MVSFVVLCNLLHFWSFLAHSLAFLNFVHVFVISKCIARTFAVGMDSILASNLDDLFLWSSVYSLYKNYTKYPHSLLIKQK